MDLLTKAKLTIKELQNDSKRYNTDQAYRDMVDAKNKEYFDHAMDSLNSKLHSKEETK